MLGEKSKITDAFEFMNSSLHRPIEQVVFVEYVLLLMTIVDETEQKRLNEYYGWVVTLDPGDWVMWGMDRSGHRELLDLRPKNPASKQTCLL